MFSDRADSNPLLSDPLLAAAAAAVDAAGQWAWIVDEKWRLVHGTDELRFSLGSIREPAAFAPRDRAYTESRNRALCGARSCRREEWSRNFLRAAERAYKTIH